jgi:sugar phosphate permease
MADRRWLWFLPVVFITYSLAYVDRTNFGFAAAGGMAADLGIDSAASALAGALFFLGYACFQVPGAHFADRGSVRWVVFGGLIAWGGLASATGLITDLNVLYVVRFLLGVAESAVMPALVVLLSRWFTSAERARANTVLILGNPVTVLWMSIVSGYLIQSAGWRTMFVVEGLPSVVWALAWVAFVADRPSKARWFAPERAAALEQAIADEQHAITPVKNYAAMFRSRRVLMLCAQYFLWSIGVYGFVLWLPSMLKQGQIGMAELGWLTSAPYAGAIIAMIFVSFLSDRAKARKPAIWPCLLIGAFAFCGSYLAVSANYWISYALLVIAGAAMYAPYGPFFAYVTELLPRNVVAAGVALVNSFGALGSFVGSYAVGVLNGATGSPAASFLLMAASLALSALVIVLLPNRARAAEAA